MWVRCASLQPSAHLFVLGSEVSSAVHDLCASILNDLPADWDVGHTILPAVGICWLKKREDAACWGKKDANKPSDQLGKIGLIRKIWYKFGIAHHALWWLWCWQNAFQSQRCPEAHPQPQPAVSSCRRLRLLQKVAHARPLTPHLLGIPQHQQPLQKEEIAEHCVYRESCNWHSSLV